MPTTYGNDIVYCLKSHCGVRGYCRQKWVLQVQIICKFSNERTCKRNKDVQGLSCGFEVQQKMNQIQSLQEKTYNYLSTVNAVVKNGKDIIYASTLARDIAKYQSEAAKYAVGDPKLLTIIAKTEYELISRSVDLMIYINNIALQGGEKNLMDNKQRIDLCIHVVNELRRMRGLAYAVCRQMKSAKRAGVLKTLVPGQFKYVNSGKQKVDNILNGIKWISKGGY